MAYFSKETLKFLSELKKNNNREWFSANKQRFETHVKEPFEIFIGDLIEIMQPYFNGLVLTPKDAIFRIYRDVRFSKDKVPYKTNVSAIVSPGGRKNKSIPGLYIEISPADMRIYSGLYMPDKQQLNNVRSHITHHLKEFQKLISNPDFVKTFGEIRGEKNKRIAKEFEEDAVTQPLLYNKQFYYFISWPAETIYKENLVEEVAKTYAIAQPVSDFLFEGIG